MDMQGAINAVAERQDLSKDEMTDVMRIIMTGNATEAQIGAFLIGLRMKGETIGEIAAAANVMREVATGVEIRADHMVDTVGTGGDGAATFNISTTCTFVAAAAGAHVAKHGNRSVSSTSGAADVLEAAGVRLDLSPGAVAACVMEAGVGFMFAPQHHQAMRFAIGPRREMGTRTLFNLLGPLTNPAAAPNQVVGVFAREWVEPVARVLAELGSNHVLVVHSDDGLDEISISAPTFIAELKDGLVKTFTIDPSELGFEKQVLSDICVENVNESLAMVRGVLDGLPGPARDIVLLNAGAAIYVAGLADNLTDGITAARTAIDSGEAKTRLERLIAVSNRA